MKKKWPYLGFLAVPILLIGFINFNIPYTISTTGLVQPAREWGIYKTLDGNLITMLNNHYLGQIATYQTAEFQRGDISSFVFNQALLQSEIIHEGDTVAWVESNDLRLKLIELRRELSYRKSLLLSYKSGNKPEDLNYQKERIELARQELSTQKALTQRIATLFTEDLVSKQEFEIAQNELKVKEFQVQIEEAAYKSALTGLKSEDQEVVVAQIEGLQNHIRELEKHIAGFNIIAPISGKVLKQRMPSTNTTLDVLVRVADFTSAVAFLPVDYYEEPYIEIGQQVTLSSSSGFIEKIGHIASIDNSIQVINRRPMVFVTVVIEPSADDKIFSNLMVTAKIHAQEVSLFEYLRRIINSVFRN